MHPVGRRVEDEARDHLVVVAEHRDDGPIGDVLADPHVDPFDLVGERSVHAERRVLGGADRGHVGHLTAPVDAVARSSGFACVCPRAPGMAAGPHRRAASRPSAKRATASSRARGRDRPVAAGEVRLGCARRGLRLGKPVASPPASASRRPRLGAIDARCASCSTAARVRETSSRRSRNIAVM